jgi:hypothetical protein
MGIEDAIDSFALCMACTNEKESEDGIKERTVSSISVINDVTTTPHFIFLSLRTDLSSLHVSFDLSSSLGRFLGFRLLGQQDGVNVGKNAAGGNGNTTK